MPDGYKCDRCDDFVETDGPFGPESRQTPKGEVRRVVVHPPTDADDEYEVHNFTLCPECRERLTEWVEDGPDIITPELSTLDISWTGAYNRLPHESLTDIGGVSRSKAKTLFDAGYKTKDDLRKADQSDLAEIDGISTPLAARIKADVGDFKSAEDVVSDIEDLLEEYDA